MTVKELIDQLGRIKKAWPDLDMEEVEVMLDHGDINFDDDPQLSIAKLDTAYILVIR